MRAAGSQVQKKVISRCSDELLILNGHEDGYEQSVAYEHSDFLARHATVRSSKRGRSKKYLSYNEFPSASVFADMLDEDSYGGFDIMDHERPSLQKKHKNRRGATSPELSDRELDVALQQAWENDRTKKKLRKQQREELRGQGHLGRKSKLNITAKNSKGTAMSLVKDKIEGFMASTSQRCWFYKNPSGAYTY